MRGLSVGQPPIFLPKFFSYFGKVKINQNRRMIDKRNSIFNQVGNIAFQRTGQADNPGKNQYLA
jgi:hypothetical protein